MAAYKMRRGRVLKGFSALIAFFMVMSLSFAAKSVQSAEFNGSVTLEGFNVDTEDWDGDWTTGNLGKSYAEGELFQVGQRFQIFRVSISDSRTFRI